MGVRYSEEELTEMRGIMLNCVTELYNKKGKMPTLDEIDDAKCGVSKHMLYTIFGSKYGLEVAMGLREPIAEPEPEEEPYTREKPFAQETYALEQKAETLSLVPGIDLSKYEHCTRLGDRHGQL